MSRLLYLCFFCSGLSGLVYQVVWVRMFGNVFGNTIYSASLVVAVFMLGLGAGSYLVGTWADRRYAVRPESLLRVFAWFEVGIAAIGLAIAAVLPHLGEVMALLSSYSRDANGWYVLSATSHAVRTGVAIVLLTPITLMMGGTLTLLIRFLVRTDLMVGRQRIAVLYGVNTAGAAAGALLADFAFVPAVGLGGAQLVALGFNLIAAGGALYLARRADLGVKRVATEEPVSTILASLPDRSVLLIALTLALSGFAAMGFEILWFRHFTLLLGGFRAVFSLLLTVILGGIAAGSLLGGLLLGRHGHPARLLMAVQALFVASSLAGLAAGDAAAIRDSITAAAASADAAGGTPGAFVELWFNLGPILLGAGIPALLMGLGFPLANAIVQQAEYAVGRRAGVLYLSNTAGAVCGSLMTGFLLLPALGIQGTATALAAAAALAVVPLALATAPRAMPALAGSMLIAIAAMAAWILLPSNHVLARTLVVPSLSGRVLTLSEGITEVIAVTEAPRAGRTLFTNGHPMSSTDPLAQRYMRALAHIPLLSIDRPERVLVIGFGVGNTAHAATLHPSIERVDLVDLSRHVLDHASYFSETNGSVLTHPRVVGSRERRTPASADGSARGLRPDNTGTAADRARRRRRALFAGVLRPGAHAAEAERFPQPMAPRLPGPRGDGARNDPRVPGRVSRERTGIGRPVEPAAHRHQRRTHPTRPGKGRGRSFAGSRRTTRLAAPRSRHGPRDRRNLRRLGGDTCRGDARRRSGHG